MKKIVPFKKEIIFKSNLSEITSISLEHSLHYDSEHLITGQFIISGEYRMNDNSLNVDDFSFNIPFDINMDEKYILDKAVIDINDFYYEIINSKVLEVNIEVSIDKLEEKPLIEPVIELIDEPVMEHQFEELSEEIEEIKENKLEEEKKMSFEKEELENRCVEIEEVEKEEVKNLFDSFTDNEEYATYKVCIVRDGDSLESIMMRYNISKEQMELYNDLKKIKIGDKLIIPSVKS